MLKAEIPESGSMISAAGISAAVCAVSAVALVAVGLAERTIESEGCGAEHLLGLWGRARGHHEQYSGVISEWLYDFRNC